MAVQKDVGLIASPLSHRFGISRLPRKAMRGNKCELHACYASVGSDLFKRKSRDAQPADYGLAAADLSVDVSPRQSLTDNIKTPRIVFEAVVDPISVTDMHSLYHCQ